LLLKIKISILEVFQNLISKRDLKIFFLILLSDKDFKNILILFASFRSLVSNFLIVCFKNKKIFFLNCLYILLIYILL